MTALALRPDELVGGPQPTYTIAIRLNRDATGSEMETLQRDGECHVERDARPAMVRLTRQAESLPVVIADALDTIAAISGLRVYWVEPAT